MIYGYTRSVEVQFKLTDEISGDTRRSATTRYPVTYLNIQMVNPVFNLEFELAEAEIDEFFDEALKELLKRILTDSTFLGKADPSFKVVKKGPGLARHYRRRMI